MTITVERPSYEDVISITVAGDDQDIEGMIDLFDRVLRALEFRQDTIDEALYS